ncbi:MAG: archaemetzincin [Planctomycetota bacterium]|jgi:archaemetzincin
MRKETLALMGVGLLAACTHAAGSPTGDVLPAKLKRLLPLHRRLGRPQPGDWRSVHHEPGQTYRQYIESEPVVPDRRRRVIYVQPLGDFTPTQRKIVGATAEILEIYFGLPVKVRKGLSLDVIPADARRKHPSWGMDQILSTYVLNDVLYPRLPKDATAYIALTASDLWPGEGWNFVFGQASLSHRVGVWSIYRNGDPEKDEEAFRLCLLRTLKTATHEIGHMFSIPHCTLFECNMCGSNHRAERDRLPLALCPQCLAKLAWATKLDAEDRFEKLIAFCRAKGLKEEQEFYEKSLAAMRGK